LADAGADLSAKDSEEMTAEALADKAREAEIAAFLKVGVSFQISYFICPSVGFNFC
jgi:hypothetical protein